MSLATYTWDGEAMRPMPRFVKPCADRFNVGERYTLEAIEERSGISHRHFFAEVREVWLNLPEILGEQFKSPAHLRKYALIRTGFCDERSIAVGSKAEAKKLAAFIEPIDDYSVVSVQGTVVSVFTAKSQSYKTMPKGEFQQSKTAVLEFLAGLIGVEPQKVSEAACG